MLTLKITSKGQVTFRKELLQHLQARPGDQLTIELLPHGHLQVSAAPRAGVDGFIGCLSTKTHRRASIAEIEAAAAETWARTPQ